MEPSAYNSTGPDGQGGTGEDPKPDPDPDQPIIPDYIDEHIKNYSLKFHLGTAGEVNMDLQWGWSLFGAASNSYNIPLSAAAINPNLPLNKVNRVNNLVSVHRKCLNAINNPGADISEFDARAQKKIIGYREKLVSSHTRNNKFALMERRVR